MKYVTGIDAGDGFFPIDEFSDESKAIERIAEYYDEDRVNGCFEDGVYSIEEVDNSGVVVDLYSVRNIR